MENKPELVRSGDRAYIIGPYGRQYVTVRAVSGYNATVEASDGSISEVAVGRLNIISNERKNCNGEA